MTDNGEFPTRLLRFSQHEALGEAPAGPVAPDKVNQHLEGLSEPSRAMTDEEVASVLNDPFATLVLRRGIFPANLPDLLGALDASNDAPEGLPEQKSFLISEGGQIPFTPGLDKGGSRLILVRGRDGSPELMISVLLAAGADPRGESVLLEVQTWDPVNQTLHFYQRQRGAWFWCGQSDMALVPPTRGEGAWDSHVNGYPLMKELRSPWVHWSGPSLKIAETAFAPDDPLRSDPLFTDVDHALNFETAVIRPLCRRWNEARFTKATVNGRVGLEQYVRQFADSTTANLASAHLEWSSVDEAGAALTDIPVTFFVDTEGLLDVLQLKAQVPTLSMSGQRYKELVEQFDLRVRGNGVDLPGDVPFCFTVPERAFEDTLGLKKLVETNTISRRLAAAVLMVDFTNPLFTPLRRNLAALFPPDIPIGGADELDDLVIDAARASAGAGDATSAVGQLLANWDLGPDAWESQLSTRITAFLAVISEKLAAPQGTEDLFRLAESRRREFRQRPLAEFGLSLPQAVAIDESSPLLDIGVDGTITARSEA